MINPAIRKLNIRKIKNDIIINNIIRTIQPNIDKQQLLIIFLTVLSFFGYYIF